MIGYDGKEYAVGDRIEIHPSTDLWMQGARFGKVVAESITRDDRVHVKMDNTGDRIWFGPEDYFRKV